MVFDTGPTLNRHRVYACVRVETHGMYPSAQFPPAHTIHATHWPNATVMLTGWLVYQQYRQQTHTVYTQQSAGVCHSPHRDVAVVDPC